MTDRRLPVPTVLVTARCYRHSSQKWSLLSFLYWWCWGLPIRRKERSFRGLAIGLSLVLVHIVCIPYYRYFLVNPARSIGPALFQGGEALSQLWLFIVAPFVGAAVSALVWNYFGDKNEKK